MPDDVAVGGFGDSSVATSTLPPLTTIRQPLAEMANATITLLLARLDGAEKPEPVVLPTELVIRDSA
ncbi:substrate-binding domain-containing protein [Nonomuraea ferruginea]